MNRDKLMSLFNKMTPSTELKKDMKEKILSSQSSNQEAKKRLTWKSKPVVALVGCVMLGVLLFLVTPLGNGISAYVTSKNASVAEITFRLAQPISGNEIVNHSSGTVKNVESRPNLRFFINGENIAKIEITTENEFLSAKDWTRTQHERYWNLEYYQRFDEETRVSTLYPERKYSKTITMTFEEDFDDYGDIWYSWRARNMHAWASEDNYSRFLGVGKTPPEPVNEEEAMEIAAGLSGPGVGHIQLDGYPDDLKEDYITITITDRQGIKFEHVIHVEVSNNELRQTVVTAKLLD